jgi:uncharacterized membrane protein
MNQEQETSIKPQESEQPIPPASDVGFQPNVGGALSYVLGFVTGIIFYLVSSDKFVRFHAVQSILLSIAFFVISAIIGVIPFLGPVIAPIIALATFLLFLYLIVKAYLGEKVILPFIGDMAERHVQG